MAEEPTQENPRRLSPAKALAPIGMMVLLFVLTIGLALVIAPLYLRQGLQAFGSEGASNPLIAVYYLIMILVVTGVILLLRKFLKKRKRRFLKYILGAAVLISTYAVIWPILTAAVYGLPPAAEEHRLSVEGPIDGIQPSTLVYEHSFGMVAEDGEVTMVSSDPASTYERLGEVIVQRNGTTYTFWDNLPQRKQYRSEFTADLPDGRPVQAVPVSSDGEDAILLSLEGPEGGRNVLLGQDGAIETLAASVPPISNVTFFPSFGSGMFAFANGTLYSALFVPSTIVPQLKFIPIMTLNETIIWARFERLFSLGELDAPRVIIGTDQGIWTGRFPHVSKVSSEVLPDQSLVWLESDGSGWEIVGIEGDTLYVMNEDGETPWSVSEYDYVMVYEDRPGGTLTVVSTERIEHYGIPELHDTTWAHLASFLLSAGLVVVLFIKPKWWIVDLAGVLMGAGVLSLIGISLSILPILLFLVLLAVYDAISVYKTKHMLTLAESVVESKLPILLVFPQKMGYRYEEEKDLMDKSRPREALFMGLGDVIIPGTLVVSASTFLAGEDGLSLLGIAPQYIVVMTSFIGLLVGYSALMYFVLKGRPQAGLPLLNSGTILGFLVGELLAYGTIIIT